MQDELKSRKKAVDWAMSITRTETPPRKVTVRLSKDQLEPHEALSYLGLAVQSALMDLGVRIGITIRETSNNEYEIIAEE